MMKKILGMLLAMALLGTACALGEAGAGPACAKVMADLLEAPNAKADVLMRYYIGTRVEVIREVDATYVQVNVGVKGGSLMGYMEKRDLAFGEKAIREVRAEAVSYKAEPETVNTLYSYPDALAPILNAEFDVDYKQVLGYRGGEWLHVEDGLGGTGFIRRDEIPLEGPDYHYASFIYVEPAEGEMTREEAIAYAKETLLSAEDPSAYMDHPETELTQDMLDACTAEVDILYYYETPDVVMYSVQFRYPDSGYVYAGIDFLMQGKEVMKIAHGNG